VFRPYHRSSGIPTLITRFAPYFRTALWLRLRPIFLLFFFFLCAALPHKMFLLSFCFFSSFFLQACVCLGIDGRRWRVLKSGLIGIGVLLQRVGVILGR